MSFFPSKTDIKMTLDGDLAVSGNGDLESTEGFDFLSREINKIIRTTNPQWRPHPSIGAGVESFIGEENSKENADYLRTAILDAVQRSGLVRQGDSITVDIIPVGLDAVAIYLNYQTTGASRRLGKLLVDYNSGISMEIEDKDLERPRPLASPYRQAGNKYLKRIKEASV